MGSLQVYTQVVATLSQTLLDNIPGSHAEYLKTHLSSVGAMICKNGKEQNICVVGTLDKVVRCAEILIQQLDTQTGTVSRVSDNGEFCCFCKRPGSVNGKGSGTLTDVLNAQAESLECAEPGSKRKLEPEDNLVGKERNKVPKIVTDSKVGKKFEDTAETTNGYQTGRKTKYGRAIKVPSKFRKSEVSMLSSDMSLEDEEDSEDDRSKHDSDTAVEMIKAKDADESANDNSQNEGVVKVRFLGPKGDKKILKKYYEDKMPYKYFCDLCSFKSKRQGHIEKHKKIHSRPEIKILECDTCDFRTVRAAVLSKHKLTHTSDLLKCDKCSYKTNDQDTLNKHIMRTHVKGPKPWLKCKHCSFEFPTRSKLSAHVEKEHFMLMGKKDEFFYCDQCDFKSKKKANIARHKDNVHKNDRPHLCDLCGKSFKRGDALTAHKETHLDKSKRRLPFTCMKCGKAFRSMASLSDHQTVHTSQRSFQCHICGQMFKSPIVQRRHIQTLHNSPCKFRCSTCKRVFSSKYALKRHERLHDDYNAGMTLADLQSKILQGQISQGQTIDAEGHLDIPLNEKVGGENTGEQISAEDENKAAIETIMIKNAIVLKQNEIGELAESLQATSEQLQPDTGVEETYIQDIHVNPTESEAEDIVAVPGDIQHIFVSSNISDVQNLASTTPQDSAIPPSEIYVSENDTQNMKELYIETEVFDEPVKQTNVQLISETSSNQELFSQVLDIGILENFQHGQLIGDSSDGQVLQLVSNDGQTYHIKLEGSLSNSLTLNSANTSSQTE